MVKISTRFHPDNPTSIQLSTLQLNFNIPLRPNQISQWRGAVNQSNGWDKEVFHNHNNGSTSQENNLHYRYPLIQYRTHQGKAAIMGIGEGSHLLRNWILEAPPAIQLGRQLMPLRINNIQDKIHTVSISATENTYYLHQYLPFNQENYRQWKAQKSLTNRIPLIEKALVGQLLSFATGIQWQLPTYLEVTLLNIHATKKVLHKVPRISFNLSFKTNLKIPNGIGLGKGVSHGFGVIRSFKE